MVKLHPHPNTHTSGGLRRVYKQWESLKRTVPTPRTSQAGITFHGRGLG